MSKKTKLSQTFSAQWGYTYIVSTNFNIDKYQMSLLYKYCSKSTMQKVLVWFKIILSKTETYKYFFIGLDVVKSKLRWKFSYSREPISTYIFLLNINFKNLVTFLIQLLYCYSLLLIWDNLNAQEAVCIIWYMHINNHG